MRKIPPQLRPEDVDESFSDILAEQTTLTSGGDRFGGEEEFGFEEPGEMDAEIEAELETESEKVEAASTSFSAWRSEHTKESRATSAPVDEILVAAHQEGEEAGRKQVQGKTLEALSESEPTVEDVQPGVAAAAGFTPAVSPEQDPEQAARKE